MQFPLVHSPCFSRNIAHMRVYKIRNSAKPSITDRGWWYNWLYRSRNEGKRAKEEIYNLSTGTFDCGLYPLNGNRNLGFPRVCSCVWPFTGQGASHPSWFRFWKVGLSRVCVARYFPAYRGTRKTRHGKGSPFVIVRLGFIASWHFAGASANKPATSAISSSARLSHFFIQFAGTSLSVPLVVVHGILIYLRERLPLSSSYRASPCWAIILDGSIGSSYFEMSLNVIRS